MRVLTQTWGALGGDDEEGTGDVAEAGFTAPLAVCISEFRDSNDKKID